MRFCKKFISILPIFLLCAWLTSVNAGELRIENVTLMKSDDDQYALSADFNIGFGTRLEEILNKGIDLHFVRDIDLIRYRWYWFDKEICHERQEIKLSYNMLTRQYRLSSGMLPQTFPSLKEALRQLSRLRNHSIAKVDDIKAGVTYRIKLNMYLDIKQLPPLFRIAAMSDNEWILATGQNRWDWEPDDTVLYQILVHKAP